MWQPAQAHGSRLTGSEMAITAARFAAVVALLGVGVARAEKSVWLARPLYPGQEALVERAEKALDKLMPPEVRQEAIIGVKELAAALKGRKGESIPCFTADSRCADPIDPFMASLGFDRFVLLEGGQDEAGYKFRVVAYEPKAGRVAPAVATNAVFERALLGALAKVVPVASTLEIRTTPPGATVYVDDVKQQGVTPLTTQVLPGERVVRVDLKLHQPVEENVLVPIRGAAHLERSLEKVAARIQVSASPPGTAIAIDGQFLGKDRIDRGIVPGPHTIRFTAENHKAVERSVTIKPEESVSIDQVLEPLPSAVGLPAPGAASKPVAAAAAAVVPPPPAPPPTQTENIFERRSYVQVAFEVDNMLGPNLVSRRWGDGTGRTESLRTDGRSLMGVNIEYGNFGRYFGLTVVGVSYVTNASNFGMSIGYDAGRGPEVSGGVTGPDYVDALRVHLVKLRAVHLQLRLPVWRFMLSAQVGPEFHIGQISAPPDNFYRQGFMVLDYLYLTGRANLRFYLFDGIYLFGAGGYSHYLIGETTNNAVRSSSTWGANAGAGYAF